MANYCQKMDTLSGSFKQIIDDAKQELTVMENKIEQRKKEELQNLDNEQKKVVNLICAVLPRDMQWEVINKVLDIAPKYELMIGITNHVSTNIFMLMNVNFMGFKYDFLLIDDCELVDFIEIMKQFYDKYYYNTNVLCLQKFDLCTKHLSMEVNDGFDIDIISGGTLTLPKSTGVNFINSYRYIQNHSSEITKEKLMYILL